MKRGGIQRSMRALMARALSFSAITAFTLNPVLAPAIAADYRTAAPVAADGQMNARFLSLGIGKSIVIDLPRDIKDVLVADPKIANAVFGAARLHHRRRDRPDQYRILRFRGPADRRL
jgi:pilus assembly protein CpaC